MLRGDSAGSTHEPPLTPSRALSGAQLTITWYVGTLQQSDNVTGTYADLPGVTSPYKPPAGPVSKFYRLRQ